jgi:hypothetical protein
VRGQGSARLWAACMLGRGWWGRLGGACGSEVARVCGACHGCQIWNGRTYHGRESRLSWKVSLCRAYTIVEFGRLSVSSDDAGRGQVRAGVGQGCGPRACWRRN